MLKYFFVAPEGLEPSQAEPESDVLPLHHEALRNKITQNI